MKNRILPGVIGALVLAVALLSFFNLKGMRLTPSEADQGILYIKVGAVEARLDMETIKGLAAVTFDAVQDTSDSGPSKHLFKGVLLRDVLLKANPELAASTLTKVTVKGTDGYTVALSYDEIAAADTVYLAYEKDGKPLGSKSKGGSGPFQLIAKTDAFSMRWCKYVSEVVAE